MISRLLIFFIRAYQMVLSPHLGHCCRFEPTCSSYAIEALRVHGAWRGLWLATRRLIRCRPFGPSGYDPVPPKLQTQAKHTDCKSVLLVKHTDCKSALLYEHP